jgi:hypothetical protein
MMGRYGIEAALSFIDEPAKGNTYFTSDQLPTLHDPHRAQGSIFITPGNHNRFKSATQRLPGGTEFDTVFGSYWKKGWGGVQALTLFKSGAELSLISADMCLRTTREAPTKVWGQGMAYRDTLEKLLTMTNAIRADYPHSGLIWILHFPPLLKVESSLALRSASKVLDAAKAAGVKYIVAGHLHRDQENKYDGVDVICTGSASSDMNAHTGNSVRLFDIEVTAKELTLSQTTYRYQAREAAFIAS